MKLKSTSAFILLILLCMSCSTTKCKWSGFQGKRCLKRGDYENAIVHLGKAVELDPSHSNNRVHLADAYLNAGQPDASWQHSKQAVNENRHEFEYMKSFMKAYTNMIKKHGLKEGVSTTQDVVNALGQPDFCCTAMKKGKEITTYVYGLIQIKFNKNNTLISLDL